MGLCQASAEEGGFLLKLDNAEDRVQMLEPVLYGTKFYIFNTAFRCNQPDLIHRASQRKAAQRRNVTNAAVLKPLLYIGVKTAGFEHAVAQQEHSLILIGSEQRTVHQALTVPDLIGKAEPFFPGYQMPVHIPGRRRSRPGRGFVIVQNQNLLRPDFQCADDAAGGERNIGFQRGKIHGWPYRISRPHSSHL